MPVLQNIAALPLEAYISHDDVINDVTHSNHVNNSVSQENQKMPKNPQKTLELGLKPRKCLENRRKPWGLGILVTSSVTSS